MNKVAGIVSARLVVTLLLLPMSISVGAQTPAVQILLTEYEASIAVQGQQSAGVLFDAQAGQANWYREQEGRSCTSCHGEDLSVSGRHQKTGKVIEPMARSINPQRLTDVKHIRKWLLRNCKWTYGRKCSAQEKGDFLLWLSTQ